MGGVNTVDLLVITSLDNLLLKLKLYTVFSQNKFFEQGGAFPFSKGSLDWCSDQLTVTCNSFKLDCFDYSGRKVFKNKLTSTADRASLLSFYLVLKLANYMSMVTPLTIIGHKSYNFCKCQTSIRHLHQKNFFF
jgi:hypothetical protein